MRDIEKRLRREAGASTSDGAERAAARFAPAAERAGLVDLAYATLDSPLGALVGVVSSKGLVRLAYEDDRGEEVLAELARRVSPRLLEMPARLEPLERELDEYFAGRRRDFAVPVDLRLAPGFARRVLAACAKLPYGETSSYGKVARAAGNERAARAAGNALGANPIPIVVPCHRVLHAGGGLGGYTGGLGRKEHLLALELGERTES